MAALASPDFDYVDHRPTSFGALDTGAFLQMARSYEDIARMSVVQKVYFADRALIARLWTRGVTADGAEVEWVSCNVWVADDAGRALHGELFAEDDWDAALARFDELSAAPSDDLRTLEIDNAASRVAHRVAGLFTEQRLADMPALMHPDIVTESRRRVVGTPAGVGWDEVAGALSVQFSSASSEPIAVRGERLAANRVVMRDDADNQSVWIAAVELDASGRITRMTNLDEEDEVAAIDLLDEWYIAGEGAEHALVLTAQLEGMRRYHAQDWDGLRAMSAPGFEFVDHRPLPWPSSDAEGLLRLMRERAAQAPDVRSRVRKLFVQGRVVLSEGSSVGTDEHGGRQEWLALTVAEFDATGRHRRIEYFAPEQLIAALARFDELAAGADEDRSAREHLDGRTPDIDTAAARALPRLLRVAQEDFLAAASLFAPDVAHFDHRSLVSLPDGTGLEAVANVYLSMVDIYSEFDAPVFAVRGDRLALVLFRATAPEGFETTAWVVVGLDAEGRIDLFWLCDESDLATAVDELDARYVASGEATEAEIDLFDTIAALNRRDWEAFTARLAPDLVTIDHSPLGFPPAGRDEFVRNQMQGLVAVVPDAVVIPVKVIVSGDAVLTSFHTIGTTAEGNRYEWKPVQVAHRGADGLIDRVGVLPRRGVGRRARPLRRVGRDIRPHRDRRRARDRQPGDGALRRRGRHVRHWWRCSGVRRPLVRRRCAPRRSSHGRLHARCLRTRRLCRGLSGHRRDVRRLRAGVPREPRRTARSRPDDLRDRRIRDRLSDRRRVRRCRTGNALRSLRPRRPRWRVPGVGGSLLRGRGCSRRLHDPAVGRLHAIARAP